MNLSCESVCVCMCVGYQTCGCFNFGSDEIADIKNANFTHSC